MVDISIQEQATIADSTTVTAGMMATIIESPDLIQKNTVIPQAHLDMCTAQGIATSGNCAGKSGGQVLNTAECNNTPADDNYG